MQSVARALNELPTQSIWKTLRFINAVPITRSRDTRSEEKDDGIEGWDEAMKMQSEVQRPKPRKVRVTSRQRHPRVVQVSHPSSLILHPSKALGQNFLVNEGVVNRIIDALAPAAMRLSSRSVPDAELSPHGSSKRPAT